MRNGFDLCFNVAYSVNQSGAYDYTVTYKINVHARYVDVSEIVIGHTVSFIQSFYDWYIS